MSVNTDPEALARMARELENMDKAVREATARVRRQLAGSRWQDPVRKNFEHLLQDIERNATGLGRCRPMALGCSSRKSASCGSIWVAEVV